MSLKTILVNQLARLISRKVRKDASNAVNCQKHIFNSLIRNARNTRFGKDHGFSSIKNYTDFKNQVPLAGYEELRHYISLINKGEKDVLWKGIPTFFAKTSGTTSGSKFIPLTKNSTPNHFGTARNAVFHYIASSGNVGFMDGKMIFLSGSPALSDTFGIPTGRLSGISNHLIPNWLKKSQLPSYQTNCIDDWETKLDNIVRETAGQDLRMISGIPPWVQMYYERLLDFTGKKTVIEVFPNFSLFVYGGVNFEPYRAKLEELVGAKVPSVETYPASEGFLAFQDLQDDNALLLNINSGIFFEFVPLDEIFNENPTRLALEDVVTGVNYAVILNTNAGLWGYKIGDTVRFVSTDPYRIVVTGRVDHFISAFGEHVISKEVEYALISVANKENTRIVEFTVAPQVNPPNNEAPFHEWFVEFDNPPENRIDFSNKVDVLMQNQNSYYKDLREGNVLQCLKINALQKNTFRHYMKSLGKLGGQNKVPRLADNRKIAVFLEKYILH